MRFFSKVIERGLVSGVFDLILRWSQITYFEWITMQQSCRIKGRLQYRDFSSVSDQKGISFIGISKSLLSQFLLFLIFVGINFLFVSCLENLWILLYSGLWWCWIPDRYVVCKLFYYLFLGSLITIFSGGVTTSPVSKGLREYEEVNNLKGLG